MKHLSRKSRTTCLVASALFLSGCLENQAQTGKVNNSGVTSSGVVVSGSNVPSSPIVSSDSNPKPATTSTPSSKVYFQSDFEGLSISGTHLSWKITDTGLLNECYFNNSASSSSYANQTLVFDPAGSGRKVLFAQDIDDDPSIGGTTRAQMTLDMKSTTDLAVYHSSHRLYLHPDLAQLIQYSGAISATGTSDWFTLFEIWNARDNSMDGDVAGSARWSFALNKASGVGQPLGWELTAETMQPASISYHFIWPKQINHNVPVPIGKWFTLDLYMKRGEGTAGQINITITVDGEQSQTIFSVNNTTIYPGRSDLVVRGFQPFKLYTSDTVMDWMRGQNKTIGVYYNDFKWFTE